MIDAAICDGDWVVVREQHTADNGDIVAALLDDEATVKGVPSGRRPYLAHAAQLQLRADYGRPRNRHG